MRYQIIFKPSAKKELNKLPEKDQFRVLALIPDLAENPFIGKKLSGKYAGSYSVRVWPYRIIYEISHHLITVIIVRIGHRKEVYN